MVQIPRQIPKTTCWVKPPKTNWQKPTPNLIAFYFFVTCFTILKFENPLIGHYSPFLDIRQYRYLSKQIIIMLILILIKQNSTSNFVNSIVILIKVTLLLY